MMRVQISALALVLASAPAFAQPMTKEQGDAILQELREIKQLLARQQPAPRPAAAKLDSVTAKDGSKFVLGKSDAPVTMIAYTDFECPFCARFEATAFPEIKRKYIDTGMVRFVLNDFPLEFHAKALKAAVSVRCAGDQGKYWEMKEKVIKAQPKIDPDSLVAYAGDLGLDVDAFKSCLGDEKRAAEIREDQKYAQSIGISGTPTFVIGKSRAGAVKGKLVVGAQPLEVFEAALKEAREAP